MVAALLCSVVEGVGMVPLVPLFEAPLRSGDCRREMKARLGESSSIIGTSWDRVVLAGICQICATCRHGLCYHLTTTVPNGLAEVTSQGCGGDFFDASPLSKRGATNRLQNRRLVAIQSRVSRCHGTLGAEGNKQSRW